jgi:hypothetical protein
MATRQTRRSSSHPRKRQTTRKAPAISATAVPEGTKREGQDGRMWIVKARRWLPAASVKLNGYQALTVDVLRKHIGKTLTVYEREYEEMWPKKSEKMFSYRFRPSGNAKQGMVIRKNWLRTQVPAIPDHVLFFVEGEGTLHNPPKMEPLELQVDSLDKKRVSSNVLNMEAFVRT